MSLPAALTWLQLLPNGTRFSCAAGPEWFRDLLPARTNGDAPPNASIVWNMPWNELAGTLDNWDAIVAINCPHVTTSRLIAGGYTYARRFAVLPSLKNARWFICLDTAKAAAASFSLYTPSRRSAHVKKAVATTLAKLRVPGWYRDEIIVAARRTSPLEAKVGDLFPGHTVRLALSSGAPEPAINRKPSAAVIDTASGEVLAFAKIAASKVSRDIIEHEAETLAGLAIRDVKIATPHLLFAGDVDGRYIAVQSPLPGTPAPAAFTQQHEQFLRALRCGPQKMAADTNMVAALPHRLDALRPPRPELREICDAILPALEQTPVTSTIVHGDFAPWNLRTHDGKLAAFDWEYAELDGLPMIDEIHFRLQLGLEMQKWDLPAAMCFLGEMSFESLDREQMRAIQSIYILDNLARLYGEGYSPDHEMVALYEQLLRQLNVPKREAALV